MKKWIATSLLVLCFLAMILPIHATDLQRQNAMLARMFGFQYPLDSAGGYKAGWITRFNESEIEQDFQKIRSNFPQVNMLRIPIGWTDMNQPILITEMEKIIALGKTYSFKFMFVLMDRVSGW